MRPTCLAAVALAALCACSPGFVHETVPSCDPGDAGNCGSGHGQGTADAGDGGVDGGDAGLADGGDGGTDAGCSPLTLNGVPAVDGCFGGAPTTATGTVNPTNCTIDISLTTATGPCIGQVIGPSNAFDGGCEGNTFTCTSPSLPGTLTCVFNGGASNCIIKICDAGTPCP
jgi:hypothetical protein